MATRPTRIPDQVADEVQTVARVLGRSPGELLERAWAAYRETPEFRHEFELVQKAFSNGDLDSVTSLLKDKSRERARGRAARVASLRKQ